MGADIVDRVEVALDMKEGDQFAVYVDEQLARVGDLGHGGHSQKFSHG